jgi:PAS domain S-box-containing protein
LGEEWASSSDPQAKIKQMLWHIKDLLEGDCNAVSMPALLEGLKDDLEELLVCLPERRLPEEARSRTDSEIEILKMTKAVETAPTAIVLTDLQGSIEYVNPSLLKNSGLCDASEAKGRSIFDFTSAEGKSKLQEEVIPALHSMGQWQGELPIVRLDGQSYMSEMICALVRDDCGKPIYLLANFYNITDRKRAEEALLLDDSRLEALQKLNGMDEASIQEIADFALEAGVKLTGSRLGYLAFVDDEEKTLFMHSWSKKAMQECDIEHKRIVYHLQETGLWGEAVRQRKAVITNDYASCPKKRGTPEGHVRVVRHMNVPIMDKGKIAIVAGLGNKEEEYNDSDVRQLTLLMSGMWKIIRRRAAEEELQRRDRLLQGAARATNYLLTTDTEAVKKALRILGETEDCDRVYILEGFELQSEEGVHSPPVQWFREFAGPVSAVSWKEILLGGQDMLSGSKPIQGMTSQISDPGRKVLEQLKVRSFLLVPIFIEGSFFALICFEDCQKERRWIDNEIAVLQATAASIGEAILRRRTEEALKRTQEELERRVAKRTAWLLRANAALHEEMAKHRKTEKELREAQQAADAASRAKSEFLANMSHEIRTPMNAVIGLAGLLLETGLTAEQRDLVETIHSSSDALLAIINDILDFSKIDEGKMKLERLPFVLRESIETSIGMVAAKAAERGLALTYSIDEHVSENILGDSVRLRQVLTNLLSNAVKFTEKGSIAIHIRPGEREGEIHFSVSDTGIGISPQDTKKLFLSFSQVDASTSRKYGGTGLGLAISKRLVELMGGRIWVQSELGQGSTFHFLISAEPFSGEAAALRLAGKKIMAVVKSEDSLKQLALFARSRQMQIYPVVSAFEAREIMPGRFDAAILDLEVPGAAELAEEMEEYLPIISLVLPGRPGVKGSTLAKPITQSSIGFVLKEALMPRNHQKRWTACRDRQHTDLKILLAEDNAVNQKVARLMLKKLGYRADVVSNGREVLQALELQSYDVILMDVQMPEMDGLEATRAILDLKLKKRPKILAMTAYALEGDRERCLAAGMDGYISKPVQLDELRNALQELQDFPLSEGKVC